MRKAFAALGYKPEQVTKILLTHRHADHSGELKSFPNAKIYVNADELNADELQGIPNIVPVTFTDGAYYNFPDSQKIQDGIWLIKAKGHTNGRMSMKHFTRTNSLLFTMILLLLVKLKTECVNLLKIIRLSIVELTRLKDMKILKQNV